MESFVFDARRSQTTEMDSTVGSPWAGSTGKLAGVRRDCLLIILRFLLVPAAHRPLLSRCACQRTTAEQMSIGSLNANHVCHCAADFRRRPSFAGCAPVARLAPLSSDG